MSSLVLVAVLLVIYNVTPIDGSFFSFCLFKAVLGWDCLGCGMTRATCSVLHLNFKEAITFNLAAFIFVPLAVIQIILGLFPSNKLSWFKDKLITIFVCVLLMNFLVKLILF